MTESRVTDPPTTASAVRRPRLDWIDTLRVALTVLVLSHHAAVTYGNIPIWYYAEVAQDPSGGLLDLHVMLNQSYFMGLFFFLSGLFVAGSVDRKGAGGFARDRLVRLGIPLLAFVLLLRPIAGLYGWLTLPDRPSYPLYYLITFDPGPTWFLEVLLVFSLVYAVVRAIRRDPVGQRSMVGETTPVGWWRAAGWLLGFAAVTGVALALWRQLVPDGTYWPIVGLPTPAYLPQYALLFVGGIVVSRHRLLERLPGAVGWLGLGLGVLAVVVAAPVLLDPATPPVLSNAASGIAMGFMGVGFSAAMLMLFRRVARGTGPVRRMLADNAFTVYVIHPVVLVGLALALQWLTAPAIGKWAVLFVLAVPVCWGLAWLLRRIPAVRSIM